MRPDLAIEKYKSHRDIKTIYGGIYRGILGCYNLGRNKKAERKELKLLRKGKMRSVLSWL